MGEENLEDGVRQKETRRHGARIAAALGLAVRQRMGPKTCLTWFACLRRR